MNSFFTTLNAPNLLYLPLGRTGSSNSDLDPQCGLDPCTLVPQTTSAGQPEPACNAPVPAQVLAGAGTADAITDIRRISGLTWDQIGELFGVDRRTVQFWASGRPPRPTHQEQLLKAHRILLHADSGDPAATRAFLLDASNGPTLKDLLAAHAWDQAQARVQGRGIRLRPVQPPPLSAKEREVRRPLPVDALLGASERPVKLENLEAPRPRLVRRRVP